MSRWFLLCAAIGLTIASADATIKKPLLVHGSRLEAAPDRLLQPGVVFEGALEARRTTPCRLFVAERRGEEYVRIVVTHPKWGFLAYVFEGSSVAASLDDDSFLRLRRVAASPARNPLAGLVRDGLPEWDAMTALGSWRRMELWLWWRPKQEQLYGQLLASDRPEERLTAEELTRHAKAMRLPRDRRLISNKLGRGLTDYRHNLQLSPARERLPGLTLAELQGRVRDAFDQKIYEGQYFNWSSRGSPVRVAFDKLDAAGGVSMVIRNYDSSARYEGRLQLNDQTVNGFPLILRQAEVLRREQGRRVGRIIGGRPGVSFGNAASPSIELAFRLGEDRRMLFAANRDGNVLTLQLKSGKSQRKPKKQRPPKKRDPATELAVAKRYLESASKLLRQRAVERLQRLIKDAPDADEAKVAASLLETLTPAGDPR